MKPRGQGLFGNVLQHLATAGALGLLSSCTINPVTGSRELAIVSAAEEVEIGRAQYQPSQQMQGGEYRVDPALTSYVREVGERLAEVSDRALPYEFVILNSSVPNAWALPGGKIAVNRGLLLELDSEAELAAVLGHEIVHAAARHGALAMQRGLLLQAGLAIATVGAAASDSDFSGLAVGAAGLGAQLINMSHGRGDELEADAYGMRYMSRAGYDPRAAISLQETFVRLSQGRDGGGLSKLFASHPPSAERVAANRATAAMLPAGGTIGREAYQNAIASLRRDAPGYAALDAAAEALAAGDIAGARREAALARDRIPGEADVQALLGDIEMRANDPARALTAYTSAVHLNDRFFYYQLRKGDAHLALGQRGEAETAYSSSIALLPTADAYLGLGRIAEARGDIARAREHYARAGGSSSAAGVAAREAEVRLDLPANPGNYLMLASGLDSNGRLLVDVRNASAIAVAGVELTVTWVEGGQSRSARRTLDGNLAAGTTRRLATGLGPFASTSAYQLTVSAARPAAE